MKKYILLSPFLLLPISAFAEVTFADSKFDSLVADVVGVIGILNPILFALAFVVFFWGLSKFILSGTGSPVDLKKGKEYMMYGILALFILVSFRAIIFYTAGGFDLRNKDNNSPTKTWQPTLPE